MKIGTAGYVIANLGLDLAGNVKDLLYQILNAA